MRDRESRYFYLYKPYLMLTQFTPQEGKQTLADLVFKFPKDAYPVGRLDADSEGLLIITNDKRVNDLLLNPSRNHERIYFAQVEGEINEENCKAMKQGVDIKVGDTFYKTKQCSVERLEEPSWLPARTPPIRYRKNIPASWVGIKLTEGKNRQVRKMTAAVGYPTLRLMRYAIENLNIENLQPGEVQELSRSEFYQVLRLR